MAYVAGDTTRWPDLTGGEVIDLRWWPLAVCAVATLAFLALAVALAQRRDVGAGLRRPRPGPAAARPGLRSPAGLALRVLRGSFRAWTGGLVAFAVAFGTLADSIGDLAGAVRGCSP